MATPTARTRATATYLPIYRGASSPADSPRQNQCPLIFPLGRPWAPWERERPLIFLFGTIRAPWEKLAATNFSPGPQDKNECPLIVFLGPIRAPWENFVATIVGTKPSLGASTLPSIAPAASPCLPLARHGGGSTEINNNSNSNDNNNPIVNDEKNKSTR